MESKNPISKRRWMTTEFYIYYVFLAFCVYDFTTNTYLMSEESFKSGKLNTRGFRYSPWLNRMQDFTDIQWRMVRGALSTITLVMGIFLIWRHTSRFLTRNTQPKTQVLVQTLGSLFFSFLFLIYLHGAFVLFILVLAWFNYLVAKKLAKFKIFGFQIAPLLIWIFNISAIILSERNDGWQFYSVFSGLGFLDKYTGVYRWHVGFNMVSLKMISFGCDYCWAIDSRQSFDLKKHLKECAICTKVTQCYKNRQESSLPIVQYDFITYLSYLLYIPLYLAGPIISYNAFASQMWNRPRIPFKTLFWYTLRLIFALVLMEVLSSIFYVLAINKSPRIWKSFNAHDIGILGFWSLNLVWLKFLCLWRYFRCVALLDGLETIENMNRCVNNNYTLTGFWRNWHTSFNRWLIRYLYIPLGGSKRKLLATLITFTFVAVWHDVKMQLLAWAWLISFLFIPEFLAKWLEKKRGKPFPRHIQAAGAAVNIFLMMLANLVGFCVGVDGVVQFLKAFVSMNGISFGIVMFCAFFVGAQMMFEIREEEKRYRARQNEPSLNNSGSTQQSVPSVP